MKLAELEQLKRVEWLSDFSRQRLLEIEKKVASGVLDVVVIGQFKRGKSSLINALVGKDILPTGVLPLTSIVTVLEHGEDKVDITYNDGRSRTTTFPELANYNTEERNPENKRGVKSIVAFSNLPDLPENIRVIDTPGIDSTNEHNSTTTREYLPNADVALLVLSAEQPLSAPELAFLKQSEAYFSKILVIVNKLDLVSATELPKIESYIRRTLEKAFPQSNFQLIALSAKTREGVKSLRSVIEKNVSRDQQSLSIASAKIKMARLIENEKRVMQMRLSFLREDEVSRLEKAQRLTTVLTDVESELGRVRVALQAEYEQLQKEINEHSLVIEEKSIREGQASLAVEMGAIQSTSTHDFKSKVRNSIAEVGQSLTELYTAEFYRFNRQLYSKLQGAYDTRYKDLLSRVSEHTKALFGIDYQTDREPPSFEPRAGFYLNPDLLIPFSKGLLVDLASFTPKFLAKRMLISHAQQVFEIALRASIESVRWEFVRTLDLDFRRYKADLIENLRRVSLDLAGVVSSKSIEKPAADETETSKLARFIHSAEAVQNQL